MITTELQHKKRRGLIPRYALLPLLSAAALNWLVYCGSKLIAAGWPHHNPSCFLDGYIPFIPQFLVIYLGCFLFWIVNYILIARQGKEECYRFFTADFLSRVVCLIFFLAYPTANQRPVLPDSGFWNHAMLLLYAADTPVNLFPSIHCLVSWFCYIGIRKNTKIPLWYRRGSCVMAVLVFISTLTTRQHTVADVAGAVILAEASLRLGQVPALWRSYGWIFGHLEEWVFQSARNKKRRSQYHEA